MDELLKAMEAKPIIGRSGDLSEAIGNIVKVTGSLLMWKRVNFREKHKQKGMMNRLRRNYHLKNRFRDTLDEWKELVNE